MNVDPEKLTLENRPVEANGIETGFVSKIFIDCGERDNWQYEVENVPVAPVGPVGPVGPIRLVLEMSVPSRVRFPLMCTWSGMVYVNIRIVSVFDVLEC